MITSKANDFIKEIRSLHDKKGRDELGLYIATGEKLVKTATEFGCSFHALIVSESEVDYAKKYSDIKFSSGAKGVVEVSNEVFKSISGEVSPQGVLAVLNKPQTLPKNDSNAILLDGVADPTNVGAILRTALASNYTEIYLTEGSADPFSPKSVRASMGGVFGVNIHFIKKEECDKIGMPIIVADMKGENAFKFKSPKRFCLCIGNEGNGVSERVKGIAKYTVSIPMENGMESLNASVSAGILMYALKENKEL
ncbi:MAG: RNA methyltransferase [Clostridia bacterium]|nr:RNA methyltransferase [Clostridia bacterium]